MRKFISFVIAYILPFIIVFWGKFDKLFMEGMKVNMVFLILGVIIFFLWKSKTKKKIARLNEGDPRINIFNILNYLFIFVVGAYFIHYVSNIVMAWHYIFLVIGMCQIVAEFLEMSHYKIKMKEDDING